MMFTIGLASGLRLNLCVFRRTRDRRAGEAREDRRCGRRVSETVCVSSQGYSKNRARCVSVNRHLPAVVKCGTLHMLDARRAHVPRDCVRGRLHRREFEPGRQKCRAAKTRPE
jgi:hypothetical protein